MDRRSFLGCLSGAAACITLTEQSSTDPPPTSADWQTFEVTTRVELLNPKGMSRIWLPVALAKETPYQRTLGLEFKADGGTATLIEEKHDSLAMVFAEFPAGTKPVIAATNRVATRNVAVDFSKPGRSPHEDRRTLAYYLRPTKLLPTDGVVKTTAAEITAGNNSDAEKARAIYEWIVENTFRNPKTRGCGLGDIRYMLESKDLGGKCADLNALFVGLARAAGLPARDVYGIRVAKSELGYKSLGASSDTVTKAQHCRAEVHLARYGWVPVDPADVRKVALEEPPGNLGLDHELVRKARARLFGSWEMNWIAYNFAHDVSLPGSDLGPLGFFMYPQGETNGHRIDCLDPDGFRYEITAREITSGTT